MEMILCAAIILRSKYLYLLCGNGFVRIIAKREGDKNVR